MYRDGTARNPFSLKGVVQQQPILRGDNCRMGTVFCFQFYANRPHVHFHGHFCNIDFPSNFFVGQTVRDVVQDAQFLER